MINRQLPKTIDPFKFAQSRLFLKGELALGKMQRLQEACQVEELEGLVEVELKGFVEKCDYVPHADSKGNTIDNPKFLKRGEKRLKILQRRLSRKKKGSMKRRKARIIVRMEMPI